MKKILKNNKIKLIKFAKELKNNKHGITLMTLAIIILIIIILSAVSIGVIFGDNGLLQQAKNAKELGETSVESTYKNMNETLTELLDKLNPSEYLFKIQSNLTTFNQTLGSFPIYYSVVAKVDGTIVYEDLIEGKISNLGSNEVKVKKNLPAGTIITIQPVYFNPNYNLTSDQTINIEIKADNQEERIANFSYEYNGMIISTSSAKM